jgi:hypothetical protein
LSHGGFDPWHLGQITGVYTEIAITRIGGNLQPSLFTSQVDRLRTNQYKAVVVLFKRYERIQ